MTRPPARSVWASWALRTCSPYGRSYNSEEGVAQAERSWSLNPSATRPGEELAEIRAPSPSSTRASTGTAGPCETPLSHHRPHGHAVHHRRGILRRGAGVRLRLYPQCDGQHPPHRDQSDPEGQAEGGGHLLRRADAENRGAGPLAHMGGHPEDIRGCSSAPTTCPPSGM